MEEVSVCRYTRFLLLASMGIVSACFAADTNRGVAPDRPASTAVSAPAKAGYIVPLDDKHRVRPGDKISFRIEEDKEPAQTLTVTDSGEIELPHGFGRYIAANKTCQSLAREIKAAVEKEFFHRATVHLGIETINNVRGKAYVSGQVAKPGPVDIPVNAPLQLREALLSAGPPLQWAKLSAVRVVRERNGKTETIIVDADAILNKGRLEKDINLEPGDLVIVPERGVIFGGG